MKTYVRPEIIVKSLATDEMLMTNVCGMKAEDVVKDHGGQGYFDGVARKRGGQDCAVVRFCSS